MGEHPTRSDTSSAPTSGWWFGKYEILGRIGVGGMAEIYLAREQVGDARRKLVIKRVRAHIAEDSEFVQMFWNEGRVATRVSHPNICHVYDYGELEGELFLAMEYVNGVTLHDLIKRAYIRGESIAHPVAIKIISQIAEALDFVHRAKSEDGSPLNIVHRDVSPHNIMVTYDGVVKLLDFGVAKSETHESMTRVGTIRGKFSYMSPEQCLNEPLDGRSDIFSLGICLYEIITGKRLYQRPTEFKAMRAIVEDDVPSIRDQKVDLPEALDSIVQMALAKDRDERFETAGSLQSALAQFLADEREVVGPSRVGAVVQWLFAKEMAEGPQLEVDTALTGGSSGTARPPSGASVSGKKIKAVFGGAAAADSVPSGRSYPQVPLAPAIPAEFAKTAVPETRQYAIVDESGSHESLAALEDEELAFGGSSAGYSAERYATDPPARRWRAPLVVASGFLLVAFAAWLAGDWVGRRRQNVTPPAPTVETTPNPPPTKVVAPVVPTESTPPTPEPDMVFEEEQGSIELTTVPPGATIFVDGQELSELTPVTLTELEPGSYSVRYVLSGHVASEETVSVVANEPAALHRELTPEETRPRPVVRNGTFGINTRPWTKVYVGSRLLGTTPIARVPLRAGTTTLTLVDGTGQSHRRRVRVSANEHENFFFEL